MCSILKINNNTSKFERIAIATPIDEITNKGSDSFSSHRFHPPHPRGFCRRNGPSGKRIAGSSSGIPGDDTPATPVSSGADLASRVGCTAAAENVKDAVVMATLLLITLWQPIDG